MKSRIQWNTYEMKAEFLTFQSTYILLNTNFHETRYVTFENVRAKTIHERFHSVKNSSNFEIAAFFTPKQQGEKGVNFKIGTIFDWMKSFLFCISSSTFIFQVRIEADQKHNRPLHLSVNYSSHQNWKQTLDPIVQSRKEDDFFKGNQNFIRKNTFSVSSQDDDMKLIENTDDNEHMKH